MAGDNGRASRLAQRVVIEQPQRTADTFGGQEIHWQPIATVWAAVEALPRTTRENAVAAQLEAQGAYRVLMHWRAGIRADMRLQWRGRILQVHTLVEADGMLELTVYEEGI